ncbi:MAG: hypothetical protein WD872_05640 [Pirellulaceae bacterium]
MARSKARQALEFVRQRAPQCDTATDLHNLFFGNGGRFAELFPTREEREAFMLTPEYLEIVEIRHSLESGRKKATTRG